MWLKGQPKDHLPSKITKNYETQERIAMTAQYIYIINIYTTLLITYIATSLFVPCYYRHSPLSGLWWPFEGGWWREEEQAITPGSSSSSSESASFVIKTNSSFASSKDFYCFFLLAIWVINTEKLIMTTTIDLLSVQLSLWLGLRWSSCTVISQLIQTIDPMSFTQGLRGRSY